MHNGLIPLHPKKEKKGRETAKVTTSVDKFESEGKSLEAVYASPPIDWAYMYFSLT